METAARRLPWLMLVPDTHVGTRMPVGMSQNSGTNFARELVVIKVWQCADPCVPVY